jgi:hypothetical protein
VYQQLKRTLLSILGWLCVILGIIGAFLPLLPTTPFLIAALACFAKSSPRFHGMLLNNSWFGPTLQQWEQTKTIQPRTKRKAMMIIVATFSLSIWVLAGRVELQLMLMLLCLLVLANVLSLKEPQ